MKKQEYIFNTEKEREEAELALYDKVNDLDKKYYSDVKKIIIGLFSLLAASAFWIAMSILIPSFVALTIGKILIALPFAISSVLNIVFVAKAIKHNRQFSKCCDEYCEVKNNAVVLEEENDIEVQDNKLLNRKEIALSRRMEKLEAIKNLKKIKQNKLNKKTNSKSKKVVSEDSQENIQTM